ncbi:MAG: hypothetical protein WAU70_14875, partial [Flavobacteriales bacterium]
MKWIIKVLKALLGPRNWRALGVFTPGIVLVLLLIAIFWNLEQGKDTVRQSLEDPWRTTFHGLGLVFLGYVTWYGSRMVGFANWEAVGVVPFIRNYGPRFLGFSCYTAVLVAIALSGGALSGELKFMWLMVVLACSLGVFALVQWRADIIADGIITRAVAWRWYIVLYAVLLLLVVASAITGPQLVVQSTLVLCMQVVFTLLVCMRSALFKLIHDKPPRWKDDKPPAKEGWLEKSFPRERGLVNKGHPELLPYDIEYKHYKFFVFGCGVVLCVYMLVAGIVSMSQSFGAFAVVLLGAGIIMGALNFMRVVRAKFSLSIGLVVFVLMFIAGRCSDHHQVQLIAASPAVRSVHQDSGALRAYLSAWLTEHVAPDTSHMTRVPVY